MTIPTGKPSRKKAIEEKCKDCIYDSLEPGNWRQQVHNCPCTTCPLYVVRPLSSKPL